MDEEDTWPSYTKEVQQGFIRCCRIRDSGLEVPRTIARLALIFLYHLHSHQ